MHPITRNKKIIRCRPYDQAVAEAHHAPPELERRRRRQQLRQLSRLERRPHQTHGDRRTLGVVAQVLTSETTTLKGTYFQNDFFG